MEVLIEQTVKNYEVAINQTAKTIDVTIVTQPKTFNTIVEPFGPRGFSGKSSYQIAVDNGFIGTEQEWLDSQKNIDGGLIF